MAKLYGEIAAKSLLTLDKSFARANGQPLDASEVYYSLDAAKAYAATAQAYIGQKIVVIENGVVSHYSVDDTAGNLKELGSKPVADGTTIEIDEDGKITLANIADKTEGTYNAVLVNGELTWVAPSATTVEGLSDLITALTGRVSTLEETINGKAAQGTEGEEGYVPAVKGLVEKLSDEVARAEAAEKALGERIDAIDFVDADELADAIKDFATDKEVEDAVKVAKDRADEAYELAETKVDSTTYATDKKALQDEDAAIREIAEAAKARIDTFMDEEGVAEVVDSLHDIKAELDKMAEATELVDALALKADLSYVNDELAKKQDVIAENTYDAYGAAATAKSEAIADAEGKIATAKQEAIDAAASAAEGIYATQTALGNLETALDGRLDTLEAINHDLYATKEELTAHDTAASAKYATKEELAPVKQTADNAAAKVETLEDKIEEITSVGGEPNVIDYVKVNGTILEVEKDAEGKSTKTVNVIVPTKASDLTDDTGFDARITAAQNAADAAQGTANAASTAAAQAQSEVDALETVVGGIQTTVAGHTTSINDHLTRIASLEQADITHATEYNTLNGIVSGHTTAIAGKAEKSEVEAVSSKASANESAIKTINETTLPALKTELQGNIDKKANSADVYTKTDIDGITGTVEEGKTLVQMIGEAKTAATYDDKEVRGLIQDNADAIENIYKVDGDTKSGVLATEIARVEGLVSTEKGRAEGAESALAGRLDTVEAFWKEALRDENEQNVIDTLKEIQDYIESDESGASAMAGSIKANSDAIAAIYKAGEGDTAASGVLVTEIARVEGKADANDTAIKAINNETTGILATAKKYTDDSIAGLPAATAQALGLVKYDDSTIKMNDNKQLYVAQVSTDILVQGSETLVLNGGKATE
jgi:hypothetical protein